MNRIGALLVERLADARGGGIHLALGQPQQRPTRLRWSAERLGSCVGLLGGDEVAELTPHLADLVVGRTLCGDEVVARELLACREGVRLRLVQMAVQELQLRTMDPTHARERRHGTALAPPERRLGPLARTPVVAELRADPDHAAVDVAGGGGIELTADDRRHALVQERHARRDVAEQAKRVALVVKAHRREIAVAAALGERERLVVAFDRAARSPSP